MAGAIYMFAVVIFFMFNVVLVSPSLKRPRGCSANEADSLWQSWPVWPLQLAGSIVSTEIRDRIELAS